MSLNQKILENLDERIIDLKKKFSEINLSLPEKIQQECHKIKSNIQAINTQSKELKTFISNINTQKDRLKSSSLFQQINLKPSFETRIALTLPFQSGCSKSSLNNHFRCCKNAQIAVVCV